MFEALFKYGRDDYARSELVYQGDWPAWLLYGIATLAAVGIATALYRRRGSAPATHLAAIGTLQLAMVAGVVWMLMQPTLATDRLRDGENTIAVVLDSSGSMAYGSPQSRFDAARQSLSTALSADDAPELAVRHYELGGAAQSVDNFLASVPEAAATSLNESLKDILEEARYNPLAAIVLSSDGADTGGGLTADELATLAAYGVPVHTIGVGDATMPDDIELADVAMPDKALPGSTVPVRVTIVHDAPGPATIKVYDGDELKALNPVELPPGAGTTTVWLEVELVEAGPHELRFAIERNGDGATETELRNNRRAMLVNVANEQYRILYYEGEPRWEYKFMRRAVAGDEDLRIATLLRVSPNKFYRQGIDTPDQLEDGFPASRDELFGYDALIIGSVEAASLSDEQQQLIRDFVSDRGGSLMMLAGPAGLGNGGWGQSVLADVLPVKLPPTSTDSFHRKKAPVSLTPQGQGSQMLRLDADADANLEAWRALPEVADYQLTGDLKPAAVALINAETEFGVVPLLVTQPYGRGQSAILASGGTWRWQMSMPLEDQKHETFWRQLLRALVASAPEAVSLRASTGGEGGAVALRAEFRDEGFRPIDDVGVTAVASHESGESLNVNLVPGEEPGVFAGRFEPPRSGTWYFEALAERDGEPVAVARVSLLHEDAQAEYFGIRRNSGLLQRLSAATGGQYFEADDLDGLPDLLRYSSAGITETEYRPIWDALFVFLVLLSLKGGEWLLRRRWGTI